MRKLPLMLAIISSLALSLPAYSFQVKVVSTNKDIQGLGFTVNGKDNGGMGREYHKSGMSKGKYSFGVRMNGKDIGCKDKSGKKFFNLTSSTQAVLSLKGNHCTADVHSS